MEREKLIKKFKGKLVVEAMIKSTILGLVIGLGFVLIMRLVSFIINLETTDLVIYFGLLLALVSSIVFYFISYRPNIKKIAGRIDGLGLDERVITMLDLEKKGVNSFIAAKQRLNTEEKLKTVNPKQLKLNLYKIPLIVLLVLIPITAGSMAFNPNASTPISSEDPIDNPIEDTRIVDAINEIKDLIRRANIKQTQKDELNLIVDDLVKRIKDLNSFDEKMNAVIQTRKEIVTKIENFIIDNLLEVLHKVIDDAEIRDGLKETLHEMVDDFKIKLSTYNTLEAKIEQIKLFVEELQEVIIVEAVQELYDLVAGAQIDQELRYFLNGLIDALVYRIANVHQTYAQKMEDIKKTKEEILKYLFPPQDPTTTDELSDLGDQLQDAINDALDQLQDLIQDGELPVEGELPIEEPVTGDTEDPDALIPPPPPVDGVVNKDVIIDGITPYLPILEEKLPGITEKLAEGKIPADLKSLIEAYLELIIKNQS